MFVIDALGVRIGFDLDTRALRDTVFSLLATMRCDGPADVLIHKSGPDLWVDGERAAVFRDDPDESGFILHLLNRTAIERTSRLTLHAAAVVHDGIAVVLPAPQEHGKTTLTAALVRSGYGYLTDEAASFEWGDALVHSFAKPLSLSRRSLEVLGLAPRGDTEPRDHLVLAEELRPDACSQPAPLGAVVFPLFDPGAGPTMTEISRGEAVLRLASHTFRFPEHGARALREFERLTRGVRAFQLTTNDLGRTVELFSSRMSELS